MVKISLFLYSFFRKRPFIPISIATVFLLAALFRIYTTKFGTDLLSYIPDEAEKTKAYIEALKHSGGERDCYIILKGDVLQNIGLIDGIAEDLRKLPEITDVRYRVDKGTGEFFLNMLKKRMPLYLDSNELDSLLKKLTPQKMSEALKRTQLRMMMPAGGEIGRIDPLALTDFMKPFPSAEGFVDTASGYYMFHGGKGLIMIASVSKDPRDISFDQKLLSNIDSVMKKKIKDADNISVTITGSHAITYYEASRMKEEMERNTLLSVLLVGSVIILFARNIRVMLYAFLPVGISIPVSLGFYGLSFGPLTEAAGGFAAMLIGLGVDITIILYVRNLFLNDMTGSIKATSAGIWAAALTTAVTFSPMLISHFRGIRELGILTGTGIILCALFLFGIVSGFIKPGKHLATYNLSSLTNLFPKGRARMLNAVIIIIVLSFSLYYTKDLRFSVDLRELGSRKNPARLALDDIVKEDSKRLFLIGNAGDTEDAIEKADKAAHDLRSSGAKDVVSIATFLPPLEKQSYAIDRLRNIDKEKIVRDFIRIASKSGLSKKFINDYSTGLKEMLSIDKPIVYEDMKDISLLKDKFLWQSGDKTEFLVIANNTGMEKIPEMEGIIITGRETVIKELTGFLKKDALKITIAGFILVNLILFITFRRPLDVIFVQLPIIIAILFTAAFLTLMGHKIHIMNAITGVMLFGIGTDYSIYFAWHLRREKDLGVVLSQTGTAVILSALTTICGFGSLYFSSYKGLSDMGLAITVGICFSILSIFLFTPLYTGRKLQDTRSDKP